MPGVYQTLIEGFNIYLTEYINEHGVQTILQIKDLAKQYAINRRNGRYDLTTKNYYVGIIVTYCNNNNIEKPNGFGDNIYDPDNEFPDDPEIQRLTDASEKRSEKRMKDFARELRNHPF